jgi:MFS family permease
LATKTTAWYRAARREHWRALVAAQLGWMLDAMDVMLYAFALTAIRDEFQLSGAGAGALASATLLASAVGGGAAGWLADRYGRTRVLIGSILVYSVFTGLTATAGTLVELVVWRALVGLGLGAEWSAGSVLVAETWPAEHRGKAIGFMQAGWAIGYILAALLAAVILPRRGWRLLFAVGVLPALLTFWIRRAVPEPEIWRQQPRHEVALAELFRSPLARRTLAATLLCALLLFAYWGLFTWIPSYLASPVEQGGAGLGIVRSSAWIVPMQVGAFLGYSLFGVLADRWGRRPVFLFFVVGAGALVPVYGAGNRHTALLAALGPLVGFFGHGYFSVFGALLAELFPSHVRGTAQGLCYNLGRAASALAPAAIGAIATYWGIGGALGVTSAFFLTAGALMFTLPETRGAELEAAA